jgi:MtrB/PioB family decaheme-associated outer membrane protein
MRMTPYAAALLVVLPLSASAQAVNPAAAQSGSAPPAQGTPPSQPPAAQSAPANAPQPADDADNRGWVAVFDVGVRGTNVNGDSSRFERYRDMGSGLFLETARATREGHGLIFDFSGQHVGRRDQRLIGEVVDPGRLRAAFMWDQIPMILSRETRTIYTGLGTNVLQIDDAIQRAAQQNVNALNPLFNQLAGKFDTKTRRLVGDGRVEYDATDALTLRALFRRTDRDGAIPFGGSFGHSSVVELPLPTQHQLSDFNADAEYVRDPILVRGGYTGSWFHNDFTEQVFDNPYRLDDTATASSRGRLRVPPSNSFIGVNGTASVKLPGRSRATAYGSIGMLQDAGDTMVPVTINTAVVAAPIQRTTVDGEAKTHSMNLRFTSRPRRWSDLVVSYRGYEYDNRTPEFTLGQRISYDNAPAAVSPPVHTEPFSVSRGTLDADFRYVISGLTSAGIGYTRNAEDRTHRIYGSTTDNVVRLTFDTMSRRWFSLRSKFEHAQRRGEGIEEGIEELVAIGEQPGMRHFDVANRNRNRATLIGSITPTGALTTSVTVAVGKDDYLESEFGMRDNTHHVFGLGADYVAAENVSFGASYSFEEYNAFSRSRQANPGPEFADPARNWAADTSDKTHGFVLNADVARIAEKVDLHLSYDFSRGRAIYSYRTGPVGDRTLPEEVSVPTTLPTPTELPPTLSEFHRGTVDLVYPVTRRLAIGASYWYDRYRVSDFTLDIENNPELVRGQAMLMGYLYRPYTANVFWGRLLYRF